MAASVLVFLAILGGAVFAAALRKQRVSEMIPASVLFLIAHTWLCGLFGLLRFSASFAVFCMIALGVAGLVIHGRRARPRPPLFDVSLLFFGLAYLWLVTISAGRMPLLLEEYRQWALAAKAMALTNSLHPAGVAAAAAPGMAVFAAVFQSVHMLVSPADGYLEWLPYLASGTACLALLMPFAHSAHPKAWVRGGYALVFYLAAVAAALLFFDLFSALAPQGFLAILAAGAFLAATRKQSLPQAVVAGLFVLVLGLCGTAGLFFGFAALLLVLGLLLRAPEFRNAGRGRRIAWIAMPAAPLLLTFFAGLPSGMTLHGVNALPETLGLFWQGLTAKAVTVRMGLSAGGSTLFSLVTVHVSFLALFVLLAGCAVYLVYAARRQAILPETRTGLLFAALAACLYTAGILLYYLFAADAADAAKLLNFDRLMAVGVVFLALVALGTWQRVFAHRPHWTWRRHLLTLASCLCLLLTLSGPVGELSARSFTADNEKHDAYYAAAEDAAARLPESARVYIVCQGDDGSAFAALRYALCPRFTNADNTFWLSDPEGKPNQWSYPVTAEQWKTTLESYDYVLIYRADNYLQKTLAPALAADGVLDGSAVYAVNRQTGLFEAVRAE